MYQCESWTVKKAKHWRIDALELWCWKRLLRVPWTARRSNQSILKEINPEYSLEGRRIKLKLQYLGHMMWRTDSLKKTLMLGSSVQFNCSVVSESRWPQELQHARPPCPSQTPGVYSNSCPSSRWWHPAISSSIIPFSSYPQSLPASGSFPMSQLFAWGGQSTGVSA